MKTFKVTVQDKFREPNFRTQFLITSKKQPSVRQLAKKFPKIDFSKVVLISPINQYHLM